MWLFAMFDLPTYNKARRRDYSRFRHRLLEQGFSMIQYSVYARYCASEEYAASIRADVKTMLPPEGEVRLLAVTDRQFGRMEMFFGKKRKPTEEPPRQIMLF